MKRKDCDNLTLTARRGLPVLCTLLCAIVTAAPTMAGTVRVRASAVVVADEIRLADVCDFEGFDPITEERAGAAVLRASPKPGNSGTIHIQAIREALSRTEVNMAGVTLTGATRCLVSRPGRRIQNSEVRIQNPPVRPTSPGAPGSAHSSSSRTLRDAVHDHFARMLERYRGRPDIVFDRTDAEALSLSAETHAFTVRTRNDVPLGLVQVEVDVVADGQDDPGAPGLAGRTIPLVVKVSMLRDVLVAHRAINQGATLGAGDIERTPLTFGRVDGRIGVVDADRIIGKRAKRFISAGSVIHLNQLENVPLVNRGQLVQLRSRSGGIQVVTTCKAMQGGLLGESITVRALDRSRLQFEATIIGAGVVEVGQASPRSAAYARSEGGQSQ